jgi:replication factor C subunit 2/4
METTIVGQDEATTICDHALKNPTHMFFYGSFGSGKTTMARDFLRSYTIMNGLPENDPDTILYLTADVDRGIHTIRAKISDFVRGVSKVKGVHRWIVLDDADSLPEVSQQALRRPMEQYTHLTYFIFIAKSQTHLIHALQSRCQPVQFNPIILQIHSPSILKQIDYRIEDSDVLTWLCATSLSSVAEFKRMALLLKWISNGNPPTIKDVKEVCSSHTYETVIPLVKAICSKNGQDCITNIATLWQNGMSFEDILHSIHQTSDIYFMLNSKGQERLYTFLLTGWSYHAQSRCSFMDLLCCCMDSGLFLD